MNKNLQVHGIWSEKESYQAQAPHIPVEETEAQRSKVLHLRWSIRWSLPWSVWVAAPEVWRGYANLHVGPSGEGMVQLTCEDNLSCRARVFMTEPYRHGGVVLWDLGGAGETEPSFVAPDNVSNSASLGWPCWTSHLL